MSKPFPAPQALAVALAGAAAVSLSAVVLAQEAPIERIEITGSAIRRIEVETALPVTTLTREDIAKTGATSATDLLQMLPAMQGYLTSSDSVNGATAGITTAALHSLPSKYTLVLVDGQRVAGQSLFAGSSIGGGFAVNLETIPLDAVERVEILTDGASALYGSDAIAGVVNFILRKNSTAGSVFFNWNAVQHAGGDSWSAGLTKGFGDLNTDHYNVLFNYSHDQQQTIMASQRPASRKGAFFPFTYKGVNYIFNQATSNTEPANITFQAVPNGSPSGTTPTRYSINPYYRLNGNCGNPNASVITDPLALKAVGESCRFNYAATVEDVPPSTRDSGLLKGYFKFNPDTTGWAEFLVTNYTTSPRYAPPAQPFDLNTTTHFPSLYNRYVIPFLAANNLSIINPGPGTNTGNPFPVTMGYRAVSAGGRTDDYTTEAEHFSTGVDGTLYGFDYKLAYTRSHNKLSDNLAGGYVSYNQLQALIANGTYDPVLGTGSASLKPAILHTNGYEFDSDLSEYSFLVQHPIFELPGGSSILAVGGEYDSDIWRQGYSPIELSNSGYSTQGTLTDLPVGGANGAVPIDASRDSWGVFGEWNFPIVKSLEVIGSARYDYYNKVHAGYQFGLVPDANGVFQQGPDADIGNASNSTTGKVTLRFQPIQQVLLRGSWGRGFRAPAITDIAGPLVFNGATAGSYACPVANAPGCVAGSAQYDLIIGANPASGPGGLKPEKSTQWTIGLRVEPIAQLSLGADLWNVKITDQVLSGGISEQWAFTHADQFKSLFISPYIDPVGGNTTIAYEQKPINGGEAEYRGLDWDFSYRTKTPIGTASAQWTGTQMFRQQYTFAPGQPANTDLGSYGPDQTVVFRTQFHVLLSLATGQWTNTLTAHYKSGYKDEPYDVSTSVFLANPNGTLGKSVAFEGLDVPSYTTFDWQTVYDYTKSMHVTVGIRNLFDKDPPLTLQNGGGGNQIGYDGRYADIFGRVIYIIGKYTF